MSIALAALAAAMLACSDAQTAQRVPGALPDTLPDTLVVSDDPELRQIGEELLPDLAKRSGLELKRPVRLARRSRAELVSYLGAQLDRELPPDRAAAVSESYTLLGMAPKGFDLRAVLLSVYTEQVAGFYDPDSTALFVMDDQPAEALRTVLIHELVHAVQDQSADLDALTARGRGNDRQTAAQAAIEGHATLVMFEYLLEVTQQRPVDLTEIPDFAAQVRPALQALAQYPALATAPRVIQESLLFPYLEGASWVQRLWRARGGRPNPLGEELPQSTEQLMSGDAPPLARRDEPTELSLQIAGATPRYTNTLGEMETRVLLEVVAGADGATAAEGWDGDRFALVDGAQGSTLAWATVWDDAASRDRFVATLEPALGKLPRPAALEATTIGGRPGALLRVGAVPAVTVTLAEAGK